MVVKKPFPDGYRPQFYLRTADVAAQISLHGANKLGMPGDNVTADLQLHFPLPVAPGLRFALREGGKTIAAGIISKVIPEEKEAPKKWDKWVIVKMQKGERKDK